MKNVLLILLAALVFTGCKQGDKEKSPGIKEKPDAENTITKDGIGNLKIGMTKTDLEKMLKATLSMKHAKDTGEIWMDTATVQYAGMEVELYFQKLYSEEPSTEMELFGLSTKSPLCKTTAGIGVGDDRNAVLTAYEENPITMGPESVMVNDTTWTLSKTNYSIHVSDDKWDKQISFYLINKKIASMEAGLQMGE
ncbi:MAG: hypothetical protein KAX45_11425 [Chitinophagaceae bacterium]|nr:hypothetical protein [Chitinophagaceae bacterium]MBP6589601.1 hypothetical protein [Chitinophagaceae bacterium]MBP8245145.1 hypothetical protein [Chitinophagaceae bacterium]